MVMSPLFDTLNRMSYVSRAQGFIYLVSVTGVTGIKETMESRVEGLVATLHGVTDKPVRITCLVMPTWEF